jgi:hypothetical protein
MLAQQGEIRLYGKGGPRPPVFDAIKGILPNAASLPESSKYKFHRDVFSCRLGLPRNKPVLTYAIPPEGACFRRPIRSPRGEALDQALTLKPPLAPGRKAKLSTVPASASARGQSTYSLSIAVCDSPED